jgi:hypothetical protein
MKPIYKILYICVIILLASCSGIKLSDNCGKQSTKTFIVLPFIGDDYACYVDVENKIRNLCYSIEDGYSMLNEYSVSVGKNYLDVSIDEFCDYAKSKGIDYVVAGTVRVEWYEGRKPVTSIVESNDYSPQINGGKFDAVSNNGKSMESNMYYIVTGNYAVVDCYGINTSTKDKIEIFHNYKVKKVAVGSPAAIN